MFTQIFDRLGNWNPQLLREWKGSLKPLTAILAVALSFLVQVGLVFGFNLLLPQPVAMHDLYRTTSPRLGFQVEENSPFLSISEVTSVQTIQGQSVSAAQQQIRVGDRVISINNKPVPNPATLSADPSPYDLVNWANDQLGYASQSITQEQFEGKATLGAPITLELYTAVTNQAYRATLAIVVSSSYRNSFCITVSEDDNTCRFNLDRQAYEINWIKWYFSLFVVCTVLLGVALVGIGGFILFSDLAEEQRRGTLNFVRMSPRSPLSIAFGKILGVPALLYLGVLVALPFHYFTGLSAGFSALGLLAFYLVFSVQLLLFYSSGFLLTLVSSRFVHFQVWLYTSLGLCLGGLATLMTLIYNLGNNDSSLNPTFVFLWAGLFSPAMPLLYALQFSPTLGSLDLGLFIQFYMGGQSLSLVAYIFLSLLNCGFILAIVYLIIDRKFHNPGTTWIPRRYSYALTIVFHLNLVLFAAPNQAVIEDGLSGSAINWIVINSTLIFIFTSFYLALLNSALTPKRQVLLDWLRFKEKDQCKSSSSELVLLQNLEVYPKTHQTKGKTMGFLSVPFIIDRSSPLPTVILNLFMAEALFILWLIFTRNTLNLEISGQNWLRILGCLAIFSAVAILLFLIGQIFWVSPFKKSQIWISFSVLGTIAAHATFMVVSYLYLDDLSKALSVPLWFNLLPEEWTMLITLSLQSLGILGLGLFHQRQLRHAARSEWAELLDIQQGRTRQRTFG